MFMKLLKSNKGVSLVEVIASVVLISLALISFYQLFINSQKTATYNNEKLAAIQLAQAELERLQLKPFEPNYLDPTKDYSTTSTEIKLDKQFHTGEKYKVTIKPSQTVDEKANRLIDVVVTVEYAGKKSSVEGYVKYD